MVECSELNSGYIKNANFNPYLHNHRFKKSSFLCPKTDHLYIQGDFGDKDFQYFEIAVKGCDMG